MRVLLATNNPGKVREFTRLLGNGDFEIVTPRELGIELDVVEDGDSYAANAAKKAGADVLTTDKKQDAYLGHSSPREPLRSPTEKEVRAEIADVAREYHCSNQEAADIIICLAHAARFEARVVALTASGLKPEVALKRAQQEDGAGAQHYNDRFRL